MDNILFTKKTPSELLQQIAAEAKQRRLGLNLTQTGLAKRSGISLGSLKRFEQTGQISLESLLKLTIVLGDTSCLDKLFIAPQPFISLDDLLKQNPTRKRGSVK